MPFKQLTFSSVIPQIGRIVENPDALAEILNNPDILRAVIHCIGAEKIAVAKQVMTDALKSILHEAFNVFTAGAVIFLVFQAIQSLSKLSHSKPGLDKLFQSDLQKIMKDVMATSDIVRYRIYEVSSTVCHFSLLSG